VSRQSNRMGRMTTKMMPRIHHVEQHRSGDLGVDLMTLVSNHHFPRHSHDQFAIGVITSGAQKSWSGIGPVEASAGDVVMANPGEMHDGIPIENKPRTWKMIYLDSAVLAGQVADEMAGRFEVARPVARDPLLAGLFLRLFKSFTSSCLERMAQEESLLRTLMCAIRRHGATHRRISCASPSVARARQRLDSAPEVQVTLAELSALSGVSRYQLLRGFLCEVGVTPHAYLVQKRVCLARRLLANSVPPARAALDAGFADQSHMTRAFVRYLGITPGRFQAALA